MNEGTIKWYNEIKGFGFIVSNSGNDFFVHRTGISSNKIPNEGQKVQFDTKESEKGTIAINVELL